MFSRVDSLAHSLNVLTVMGGLASLPLAAQTPSLEAAHIDMSATVEFDGTPERVFALLEPQGRQLRITSWNLEFLYPPTGAAEPGAVVRQVHRSGAVEQIWLLSEREPPTRIKYVIFVAGMEVWEFDVRLRSSGEDKTVASVNHRITSLADEVNREVQAFADGFDAYIERWRNSINSKLREQ